MTVADVIRAVDGPLVSVYGLRPEAVSYNESAEILQHVWIAARTSLREVFENVTIEALAARDAARTTSRRSPSTTTPGSRTDLGSGQASATCSSTSRHPQFTCWWWTSVDASVAWHDES